MKRIAFIISGILMIIIFYQFFKADRVLSDLKAKIIATPIKEILQDPRKFEDQIVTVYGVVESSFSLGIKVYSINDETATIYVVTDNAVPMEGEKLLVSGKFNQFVKIAGSQYSVIWERKE